MDFEPVFSSISTEVAGSFSFCRVENSQQILQGAIQIRVYHLLESATLFFAFGGASTFGRVFVFFFRIISFVIAKI